jgi:Coenzyme PQQ synthesis protein D (PqqD)
MTDVADAASTDRIGRDTVLRHAPSALERRTSDSVVLLADEPPIVLRGTGVAIWDAFLSPRTVGEAATALADAYGEPVEVVEQAMLPVLEDLRRAHAVIVVPEEDRSRAT